jgi:hypothetical protein
MLLNTTAAWPWQGSTLAMATLHKSMTVKESGTRLRSAAAARARGEDMTGFRKHRQAAVYSSARRDLLLATVLVQGVNTR